MLVKKRNGQFEEAKLDKLTQRIERLKGDLNIEPIIIAKKAADGLYDKISTKELDEILIQTSAFLTSVDPDYSKIASRLLASVIEKEVKSMEIGSFLESIKMSYNQGLLSEEVFEFVKKNHIKLERALSHKRDSLFDFFGLKTVYDRYLLKHPTERTVIETPQYFFMRVACGLANTAHEAVELYNVLSNHDAMMSTPTLFNSGTKRPQMSSCYLLDSPEDDLKSIFDNFSEISQLSKWAGGIGLSYSRVRSKGSLIKGTNGFSNGLVPWLKIMDSTIAAVNQCFDPSTPLFTDSGVKNISDVKPGDLVLTYRGHFRTVLKTMSYPQKDRMLEIETKYSVDPIRVTDGHPIYAIKGAKLAESHKNIYKQLEDGRLKADWIESGKLEKNDYVGIPVPRESVTTKLTEDDFEFYGIMLGDGHVCANRAEAGVTLGHLKNDVRQFVKNYLSSKGVNFWEVSDESTNMIRWTHKNLPFEYADIYDQDGSKAISPRYLHISPPMALKIVKGLIQTDGGIYRKNEVHFYTSSKPLLLGFKYLLLKNEILASVSETTHAAHSGTKANGRSYNVSDSTGYDVRVPAVEALAKELGISQTFKKNWLNYNGMLFSRITSVAECETSNIVYDMKVEGDESYTVLDFLAHNGGKRKGSACVYVDTWHKDVEAFLELRDNTGDPEQRTHNLNLANWIPNLFMERVEKNEEWTLFDPKDTPDLVDLFGDAFNEAYLKYESKPGLGKKVAARDLYSRMMKTLAQTGNGWMCYKDHSNVKSNQTLMPGNSIHSSNLCTEILEVTNKDQVAVCNLASPNLSKFVAKDDNGNVFVDFARLSKVVKVLIKFLNRVVDKNYYPVSRAKASNNIWRPVGLGVMGLQDVFFQMDIAFDSNEAKQISTKIQEEIYFAALEESCELAKREGAHDNFTHTRASKGLLQFDLWGVEKHDERWIALKEEITKHGLRNSLLIAIAPTATIASIVGAYECIEPQVSNLFKRETLSGEFLQINRYLVAKLKTLGLWTEEIRNKIRVSEGSIQGIDEIPDQVKKVYRTAWELSMRDLIDMAAMRSPYIDQSQSLNLFVESPNIGKLSSMYMYAWKQGLKTTYYLRSRPATKIAKAAQSTSVNEAETPKKPVTDSEAVTCSLENPGSCESCT